MLLVVVMVVTALVVTGEGLRGSSDWLTGVAAVIPHADALACVAVRLEYCAAVDLEFQVAKFQSQTPYRLWVVLVA